LTKSINPKKKEQRYLNRNIVYRQSRSNLERKNCSKTKMCQFETIEAFSVKSKQNYLPSTLAPCLIVVLKGISRTIGENTQSFRFYCRRTEN